MGLGVGGKPRGAVHRVLQPHNTCSQELISYYVTLNGGDLIRCCWACSYDECLLQRLHLHPAS